MTHDLQPTLQESDVPNFTSFLRTIRAHLPDVPLRGAPGISQWSIANADPHLQRYFGGDYLLYRGPSGIVSGILHRYAKDKWPFIKAGEVFVVVATRLRRQGIASMLLREAEKRWSLDATIQQYTMPGAALMRNFLAGQTPGERNHSTI